ncbi:hypothetical protein BH09ACT10_BH09ACT10_23610 [soil metagenome]
MKKSIIALVSALALVFAAATVTGSAAPAAPLTTSQYLTKFAEIATKTAGTPVTVSNTLPYPDSIPTKIKVKIVKNGKTLTVTISVSAGSASPGTGTIKIVFLGKTYIVKVKDGVAKFTFVPPAKLIAKAKVYFEPNASHIWKESAASFEIKVG